MYCLSNRVMNFKDKGQIISDAIKKSLFIMSVMETLEKYIIEFDWVILLCVAYKSVNDDSTLLTMWFLDVVHVLSPVHVYTY